MITTGDSFSHKFTISTEIYQGFIQVFNDKNPLHTDRDFAIAKGFNDRVMHGNILNGFLSYFVGECLPTKNVVIHSQEIKYHHPVYLEDELTLHAIVKNVYESVNAIEFKFKFSNQSQVLIAKGAIQIGLL